MKRTRWHRTSKQTTLLNSPKVHIPIHLQFAKRGSWANGFPDIVDALDLTDEEKEDLIDAAEGIYREGFHQGLTLSGLNYLQTLYRNGLRMPRLSDLRKSIFQHLPVKKAKDLK